MGESKSSQMLLFSLTGRHDPAHWFMAGLLCETIVRLEGVCVCVYISVHVSLCVHSFMLDCMHVYGRLLVQVHVCVHVKCGPVCTHVCICVAAWREEGAPHDQGSWGGIRQQRKAVSESALTLWSDKPATQTRDGQLSPFLFYGSMIEHQQQDRCSIQNESNSCPEVLRLSSVTCQYPSSQMRLEKNKQHFCHCSAVTYVYLACVVDITQTPLYRTRQ